MRTSNLFVILVIGCCFSLCSQEANAQYIHGRTSVDYDEFTNYPVDLGDFRGFLETK